MSDLTRHTLAVLAPGATDTAIDAAIAELRAPGHLVEVELSIDPVGELDPRRSWPSPAGAAGVLQIDGHRPDTLVDVTRSHDLAVAGVLCTERRQFRRSGSASPLVGPRRGCTQISFVAAAADIDEATFAARYAGHLDIVRTEHPGVEHYRQDRVTDVIAAAPELTATVAVSQLWFATDDDFTQQYYASAQSPAIVRADVVTFLDYRRTWSILTRESHH